MIAKQGCGIVPVIDPGRSTGDDPLSQKSAQIGWKSVTIKSIRKENFARIDPGRFGQRGNSTVLLGRPEFSGGDIQPGTAPVPRNLTERQQEIVFVRDK